MASKKMLELMNQGIARELQVSIQYMWQHVLAKGFKGAVVGEALKKAAITEMKHAEAIAEQLDALGGIPTTKPEPIFVGDSVDAMLKTDIKSEAEAIELYTQIIELARKENDIITENLFLGILEDEVEHKRDFENYLN